MNILSYLKQPFPKAGNKWRTITIISLFVPLFLFIFQPFGIKGIESGNGKYLFIGGFGLVSFIILIIEVIIIEHLFSRVFNGKNWRLYKELLWLFCIVFSIGLGNVFYTMLVSGKDLTLAYIISSQLVTFAVAIFPITIFTISKQNYLLKKHTASANGLNNRLEIKSTVSEENTFITLYSYNKKTKEEFDINNLYYIESKVNDIELNIYENNHIISKTLRNTLKKTLGYLADSPELTQCHRAYIVNLSKVKKVEGNSQGLLLNLENCKVKVPVSRSFVNTIKDKLR